MSFEREKKKKKKAKGRKRCIKKDRGRERKRWKNLFEERDTRRHVISVENEGGDLTFVIKEAVLGEDEPPFLPEHQPLGSLFV